MKAENSGNRDCQQRDSAEHKEYAEVISLDMERKGGAPPELLEKILLRIT